MTSVDYAHRANEAIPFPDHGLQEARPFGVVAEGSAYLSHDIVDISLGIDKEVGAPEFCNNILARNKLISPAHQEDQQLHRFLLEFHGPSATADFVTTQVEFNFVDCRFCAPHEIFVGIIPQESAICDDIPKIYKLYLPSIVAALGSRENPRSSNQPTEATP
jgi:hypothetical protein